MTNKEEKPQKKVRRGGGFGRYAYGYVINPIKRKILFTIMKVFGLSISLALVFFLLSGGINQVKTGETLVEYSLDVGENISNFFKSLTKGTSPFKFTSDGVYFKDAEVPTNGVFDGKEGLINDDSKLSDWKEVLGEKSDSKKNEDETKEESVDNPEKEDNTDDGGK